ncbi:DUF2188 domain-containing protein [Arthrobacter sp. ov407]|uniref:DUF2188 domain-containing protein n=1 Tax=Arthrobacter sp. ov407 TaxID=1761748 RepID=UPI00352576B1
MAERNSYHVVPGDDGWKAEREGSSRASSVHDTPKLRQLMQPGVTSPGMAEGS